MRKRLFGRFFVFLIILAIGLCALTACVVKPTPEEPEDHTSEYLKNLGGIIANTLAMNPEEGFLMDLAANAAWKFAKEEKSQYDWSYGLTVKANVFADDETKQGIAIELKETSGNGDSDGNLLFGLYNTPNEDLYVTVGENTKYHFDKVGVSTAIKTLLKSNGIDLDFNLKDMEAGTMGGLGELVSSSLPLLALVTDNVVQNGNDFTIELKFSKIYELVKAFVNMSTLPEAVTNFLPKEMTVKAILRTDGNVLNGIDVVDTVITTQDGAGDGTFNMTSKFNLFGAPAKSLDVESMVSDELKALEARKILNVDTHGDILFEKTESANPDEKDSKDTVVTTRTISWRLAANLDLFKIMERNFILNDEIFNDNFLHFQLKLDGEPVLDLAFSPATLNTYDLVVGANLKVLLNTVLPDIEISEGVKLGDMLEMLLGENFFLPINTQALGYMISGNGGTVEEPLPVSNRENSAKYESADLEVKAAEEKEGFDIGAVIGIIGKVVSLGNGELKIDVAELMKELKLDVSITDIIGNLTGGGATARFTNTVFEFATAKNESYNVRAEMQKGKYDEATGEYAKRQINGMNGVGSAVDLKFETDEGFLKVYNNGDEKIVSYARGMRTTLKELNSYVNNPDFKVRFSGHDLAGKELEFSSDNGLLCSAPIAGYIGLDPTKIGLQQTIDVVTGFPDTSGIIALLQSILGSAEGSTDLGGFDISKVTDILDSLKFGTFQADVILSEADYEVGVYIKATGKELGADELPNILNTGYSSEYELRGKATYYANGAFLENLVEEETNGSFSDWSQNPNKYQPISLKGTTCPLVFSSDVNTKFHIVSQGDVSVSLLFKDMEFEKVYRFEAPKETTYTLNTAKGKDSFKLGSSEMYGRIWQYFILKSVYGREDKDLEISYTVLSSNWNDFEFVNIEEVTDLKISDLDTKTIGNFNIIFTKSGIARFNVKINGILMTTVEIPVLPDAENAVISDALFTSVEGVESTKLTGNFSFDLKGSIASATYRKVKLSVIVTMENGDKIPNVALTVNDGVDSAFELSESGKQSVRFEIAGLPAKTEKANVQFTVHYYGVSMTLISDAVVPLG